MVWGLAQLHCVVWAPKKENYNEGWHVANQNRIPYALTNEILLKKIENIHEIHLYNKLQSYLLGLNI